MATMHGVLHLVFVGSRCNSTRAPCSTLSAVRYSQVKHCVTGISSALPARALCCCSKRLASLASMQQPCAHCFTLPPQQGCCSPISIITIIQPRLRSRCLDRFSFRVLSIFKHRLADRSTVRADMACRLWRLLEGGSTLVDCRGSIA